MDNSKIEEIGDPQLAQICAWCGEYIMGHQETTTYDGTDRRYKDWMVHAECETIFNRPST